MIHQILYLVIIVIWTLLFWYIKIKVNELNKLNNTIFAEQIIFDKQQKVLLSFIKNTFTISASISLLFIAYIKQINNIYEIIGAVLGGGLIGYILSLIVTLIVINKTGKIEI